MGKKEEKTGRLKIPGMTEKTGRTERPEKKEGLGRKEITERTRKFTRDAFLRKKRGGQIGRRRVNRQAKDRLFRFLFEKDREALLQLYNTLNGTEYQDASRLKVVTIESAVYMVMKNDLAFVLAGTLNLYEHQSTFNPNMPLRFLIYLAQEYQMLVEEAQESLYGSKRIMLPTPQCVGSEEMPRHFFERVRSTLL